MKVNEIYFIDRTIKHIRRVQDNMILLEKNRDKLPFKIVKWDLIRSALKHDHTKFNKELVDDYVIINTFHRNKRLGLPTNRLEYEKTKKSFEKHKDLEWHHLMPAYRNIHFIDIYEMCCDLAAISQEFNEKDYTKYFKDVLSIQEPGLSQYSEGIIKVLELLQKLNK